MEKALQNFGLREVLEILFPGIYVTSFIYLCVNELTTINITNNSFINGVIFSLFSILIGLIFYWINLPKKIPFFKNNLPTEKLIKNHTNITKTKLINAFFKYYDNAISEKQKTKTDTYTALYHFTINIALGSVILLIVYCCFCKNYYNHITIILIILILSIINALGLFYGEKKIKYMFDRQYNSFINSDNYKTLIQE